MIIGSAAWDQDYDESYLRPDFDLILKKQSFIDLLNGKNTVINFSNNRLLGGGINNFINIPN